MNLEMINLDVRLSDIQNPTPTVACTGPIICDGVGSDELAMLVEQVKA